MKKLSIIIPVFNEEQTISSILEKIARQKTDEWEKELIVVDDGSTDTSAEKIQILAASANIRVITHPRNMGKGAAIRSGLKETTGDAILIQDADLEYAPEDWPLLLSELEDPKITAVYGSRNIKPDRRGYWYCRWGVDFLTSCMNLLFGSRLTDCYTCYKLIRANVLKKIRLTSSGFEIEAELTARLLKQGYEIREVPIHYYPRSYQEGKKIKIADGLKGLWAILKIKFFSKN